MNSEQNTTLVDLLRERARHEPQEKAFAFVSSGLGEQQIAFVTYGELDARARAVAGALQLRGMQGGIALLAYPAGFEFLFALFGCLYAGTIAVPLNPPRRNSHLKRCLTVAKDAGATVILTTGRGGNSEFVSLSTASEAGMDVLNTELLNEPDAWRDPQTSPQSVAYIQYTSGSTSDPKGVMISHRNVLSNCRDMALSCPQDNSSVFVCWAPNFHDMGLIYGIMQPLYRGNLGVLMPPARFIQDPLLWLESIAHFRATHSIAPTFALDLTVEKFDAGRVARLDLSSWRTAIVGAEPVKWESLKQFQRCYGPFGFSRGVFRPAYGLAEATLKVTCGGQGEPYRTVTISAEALKTNRVVDVAPGDPCARMIVGCGRPVEGTSVLIVDPESQKECSPGEIGEVLVRNTSVASGYWRKPAESRATFEAVINGTESYLRTGDLGFMREDELFITGRKKDLIIIRGSNYYPQDIEWIVEAAHESIRPGFSAAFGTQVSGEERLVIVLEVEREKRKTGLKEVAAAVVKQVTDSFDLRPHAVMLMKPGGVPRTSSGKVQRRAAERAFREGTLTPLYHWSESQPEEIAAQAKQRDKMGLRENLETWLVARVARVSGLKPGAVDVAKPFVDFGIDSREAVTISAELARWLGRPIAPSALYEWPSIARLAAHFSNGCTDSAVSGGIATPKNENLAPAIALVGMACRFPGARNPVEFWQLLAECKDEIREIPKDRWDAGQFYDPDPGLPGKANTRWGGFLEDIDMFDAAFFGVSPREAAQMDPQQRLLLELVWEALEDAGIPRLKTAGSRTGVFVGISTSDYAKRRCQTDWDGNVYRVTGNAHSIAANRLSYTFDWHGPSMAIDTACSSSLVAIHAACQALRNGECSVAVAGGVNLILSPEIAIHFSKAGMMASDGRCKVFDERADGYVRSEGGGLMVLKPLATAIEDGDRIYCVLRGSAVNQDGRSNGMLAPVGKAQIEVIREACSRAAVKPGHLSYVEAHGTGTLLGDAIEVASLSEALAEGRQVSDRCLVGSVKSNIGHLEAAAGVAGLMKVALAFWHGEIPATLHFSKENPHVQFGSTCLEVADARRALRAEQRFAGVSSFGFGGTNSHVVVERAPDPTIRTTQRTPDCLLLPLSAKSTEALSALRNQFRTFLEQAADEDLYDICYTASVRRTHHAHRCAAAGTSKEELIRQLSQMTALPAPADRKTVFVFSGQGSHWKGMGQELLSISPVFRAAIAECDRALRKHSSWPLLTWMQDQSGDASEALDCRLPAIFSIQVALAACLRSLGVRPDAVVGHSMGELAAAHVAGVLTLEDAMRLVYVRGNLLKRIQGTWRVLLVNISAEELSPYLVAHQYHAFLTAYNSPHSTVVTGDPDSLTELTRTLQDADIRARTVAMEFPSHCPAVETLKSDYMAALGKLEWHKPAIHIVSTVTGNSGEELRWDAEYWWRNLREPVRFSTAIAELLESNANTFIEVSPHCILSGAISECAKELHRELTMIPAMMRGRAQDLTLLEGVARLYSTGLDVNWERLFVSPGRTLSLPTYPFERQRYWTDGNEMNDGNGMKSVKPSNGTDLLRALPMSSGPERKIQLIQQLRAIVAPLLEIDSEKLDVHAPFLELGADSIVLVRVTETIQKRLGVSLSIGDLFQRYPTLEAVAAYVLQNDQGADLTEAGAGAGNVRANGHIQPRAESLSALGGLMAQQLNTVERVIAEQLRLLENSFRDVAASSVTAMPEKRVLPQAAKVAEERVHRPSIDVSSKQLTVAPSGFIPYTPIRPWDDPRENGKSQQHLKQLVARLTAKSKRSKELTQLHRGRLADNRASAGFRFSVKEMLYPIIGHRSHGSRIWDVDGNEYLDLTMGFGVNLFGHNPPFITEAIAEQLALGMQLGPQSELAGEVAELVCKLTGMDRAVFVNSGTEAVMTAIRLARTATGRKKIVLFAGSYHGTFDGVLGKQKSAECEAEPLAPGVPPSMVQDVVVLDYGEPGSLEIIRKIGHECACVLVEPVQSRRPALQPREYLHDLRTLASELDIALIFDEVITGFRVAPGGAQEVFGVRADLATYGKVLGGGMPIGAVAGAKRFLDGIDGGHWSYGDASYPGATTTFFAGTFCKHPLTMAAARAVLKHLRAQGPSLQRELNDRTLGFSATLNTFFEKEDVSLRISNFGSLFRFTYSNNLDLLFYNLLDRGVYVWEGRNCFLSTVHSKRDVDTMVWAVQDTICQLKADGILESSGTSGHAGVIREKTAPRYLPLTDAQKLLWTLTQLDERASVAYNVSVGLEMQGPLDVTLLVKAVNHVVQQHEALRTTLTADGERQVIADQLEIECPVEDLSALYREHKSERKAEWIRAQAAARFDLNAGPLLRASLLKTGSTEHLLILTAHHIVTDGWSMGILVGQVCASYGALAGGRAPELGKGLQFSEYADWLAKKSQAATWPDDRGYWLNEYSAGIPDLTLPTSKAGLVDRSYSGDSVNGGLKVGLVHKLQEFARVRHCTPFMTLFAAYGLMLQRITGQPELVVGVPMARRSFEGAEGIVGYCLEVAPVKLDLSSHLDETQYLTYVKQKLLEAFSHNSYSLGELIRELRPNRQVGRTPLFNAFFNFDRPVDLAEVHGLKTCLIPVRNSTSKFDISLNLIQRADGLDAELEYSSDLLDRDDAARFLACWQELLGQMIEHPERRVSELRMVAGEERSRVVERWNDTACEYPRTSSIVELFEAQVERDPKATAVADDERQLSYGELNRRANQLAHHLRGLQVGPEVHVGVCVDRNIDMVVTLMGVLKAGGAYVPLDSNYPAERLNDMIEDAEVTLVLTTASIGEAVGWKAGIKKICVDRQWEEIARQSTSNPKRLTSQENVAYTIYTSGSTGKPKGVMISYQSLDNILHSVSKLVGISEKDVLLATTTICFDIAGLELFAPLITGGRLVIAPGGKAEMEDLLRLIEEQHVTVMQATPSLWRVVAAGEWNRSWGKVKILCGGEPLDHATADRLQQVGERVWNLYGPTETTIWSTVHQVQNEEGHGWVSVGKPIANTQIYVLEENLEPAPVGVLGEIYIGGHGLARGYWNRARLTAERFVPNPFSRSGGERLYRTGDLGRWRRDGYLEYAGRTDHQVKIRGFRIELGEIEATLKRQPGVRDCAVVVREEVAGDKRLVAYVVGTGAQGGEGLAEEGLVAGLRQQVRQSLPEYMLPSSYMLLEQLPLTPNGKLDRRALPAPGPSRPKLEKRFEGPRNEVEHVLAGIWRGLLRLEQVGVHDNFFELGGDSILGIQVIARASQALGVRLTVKQLFQQQTIAELAAEFTRALGATLDDCGSRLAAVTPSDFPSANLTQAELTTVIKTSRAGVDNVYRLSGMQHGLLFVVEAGQFPYSYLQQFTCAIQGPLNPGTLRLAWQRVVERHESLRASFFWKGISHPVHVIAKQVDLPFEELDWRGQSEQEQQQRWDAWLAADRDCGFNLTYPPLMRWTLARVGEESYRLLWSHHHLLVDGWSLPIILREMLSFYEGLLWGNEPQLEPAPSFGEHVAWLMQQDHEAAREFWTKALRGYSTPLALSIDRGHAEVRRGQSKDMYRQREVSLSEAETQALEGFARRHRLTLNTMIQGAWSILLSRYGGQKDVVFGATVSGRASGILGIESMVGLCINTVPVRARVDERKLVEWLEDLQAFNANARQHEYAALADIHACSEIPQDQPLFESILVFGNYPFDEGSLEGGGIALKSPGLYCETEYPLGLGVGMGVRLVIEIAHDVRRYDSDAVTRMMTHLLTILSNMVSHPERRISELRMLPQQERHQILEQWNATACDYTRELSIPALFEIQVARHPKALAVTFAGKQLSYGELNERANQLAWYLRQHGVGPESRVGICLERSLELVVSLLAVLKAGAAYVPLDAEYPPERLAFMVEDAGVSALISKTTLLERLPVVKTRLMCLEAEAEAIGNHSNTNLTHQTTADNLAYIIYTSGSTGKPKGAMNTHGALCNRLMWMQRMYSLAPEDRVLQKTPFSFDVSVWEFFWPLLWGARLVMARPGGHRDRDYLVDVIEHEGITTLHFVPSMLSLFLGATGLERCRSLKRVICSGEALPCEVACEFFKHSQAELHNLYGPTEAAIDVTYWPCDREMHQGPIPIGKPIANTQMYVLEENLEPAPVGVLGEIYIGGDGLARGYWNQAGLTAERFVPNPFRPGKRLYRTGDLGRWRDDGNLEYAGRCDNQVKIRGFRIELGEIEATLKRQPGVRDCVVDVREDVPGDKRLVAYIVGPETLVKALHEPLRQSLPEHMVPSAFMRLEDIPLTPNGKLDRRALPLPAHSRLDLEVGYVAPRNDVEEKLATICGDLLHVKKPGIHDNFFELGGHSLLLMQLASRIHCEFGANVPLRLLFDDPTIAGMTDAIACVQAEGADEQELAALLSQLGNTTPVARAASAE